LGSGNIDRLAAILAKSTIYSVGVTAGRTLITDGRTTPAAERAGLAVISPAIRAPHRSALARFFDNSIQDSARIGVLLALFGGHHAPEPGGIIAKMSVGIQWGASGLLGWRFVCE
jgi:hypothetical protein